MNPSSVIATRLKRPPGPRRRVANRVLPLLGRQHRLVARPGDMAAPLERFKATFRRVGVDTLPLIHRGWFDDTIPAQLPDRISFAMIDCDLYESTLHVLPHLYARMSPAAIGMFGVYYDAAVYAREGIAATYASPGVKRPR